MKYARPQGIGQAYADYQIMLVTFYQPILGICNLPYPKRFCKHLLSENKTSFPLNSISHSQQFSSTYTVHQPTLPLFQKPKSNNARSSTHARVQVALDREHGQYTSFTLCRGHTLYPQVVIPICRGCKSHIFTPEVNRQGFTMRPLQRVLLCGSSYGIACHRSNLQFQ